MTITQQQAIEALERVYYATHASFIDRNLVRQYIEQGADGWIAIPEGGMPPLGEQVLVWCKFGPHWGPMVDCWDEQHEAPLSFSSETIPIGPGWDSGSDFYDVTHWKPIGAPVAVQHPQQEQPTRHPGCTAGTDEECTVRRCGDVCTERKQEQSK